MEVLEKINAPKAKEKVEEYRDKLLETESLQLSPLQSPDENEGALGFLKSPVPDIEPKDPWTVERFKALLSTQTYREVYESRNQTEKLCKFGTDLMNLVQREQWQLTPRFNKNYFALYFKGKRVFGVHLRGNEWALRVWLSKDELDERNNEEYTYVYRISYECGFYPRHVTVANIEDILEFAYNVRSLYEA